MTASPRLRDLWPRRAPGLPPGQRRLAAFPRFGDKPKQRPPVTSGPVTLEIAEVGLTPIVLTHDDLVEVGLVEQRSDFHCVTTWTYQGVLWSGVPLASIWERLIAPRLAEAVASTTSWLEGPTRTRQSCSAWSSSSLRTRS